MDFRLCRGFRLTSALFKGQIYMGLSRQEYWNGMPFPSPGDLPNPGIKLRSPTLQADLYCLSHWGSQDQARILERVAISFSMGSSQPRNPTQVSYILGRFFTDWATREAPSIYTYTCKWVCVKTGEIWVRSLDCTGISFLVWFYTVVMQDVTTGAKEYGISLYDFLTLPGKL